jgi:hypothetical protein
MSEKNPYLSPLNSQKQLLIAESELNRAELSREWQTTTEEICALANRARNISIFASAAASLVAGLASFRHKKSSSPVDEKPSWWRTIFKGAGMFYTFWQAFHSRDHGQKEK